MGITKIELAALRKADDLCFDHYTRGGTLVTQIRAIKRADSTEADPFAHDVTVAIGVESTVHDYSAGAHGRDRDHYRCYTMVHSSDHSQVWQTIAGLLKVGDDLVVNWIAAVNNGYVNDARLFHDKVQLTVIRAARRLVFNVTSEVCADNSARMVRYSEYALV